MNDNWLRKWLLTLIIYLCRVKEADMPTVAANSGEPAASFRYFDVIMALFVAVLLISNIASTKILTLWKFTFDGGTILFPMSYIFGDILTEVYGYRRSRKVIWTGFFATLMMSLILWVVQVLPPAGEWPYQEAFEKVIGFVPRIVLASLVAYFAGEFTNSWLLSRLKLLMEGKYLWMRTIGSTLAGEGIDTLLFCLIAFYGLLPGNLLLTVFLSNYIFKCTVEILFTPVTYAGVRFLKKRENIDVYDRGISYNPFRFM
ncbi:MAG TPA: queuosine precursor transporter [Prolixibacteraceae bacterium]|nr:queuosine precursor transporter [Prolixibacteraceae bacterium]